MKWMIKEIEWNGTRMMPTVYTDKEYAIMELETFRCVNERKAYALVEIKEEEEEEEA